MELVLMSSVMNSANRQTFYGISHILTYIKKESEKFILKNIKVSVYCSGCGEGKYSTVPLPRSGFDSFRPRLNIWSQIHLLKKQTKNVFTTARNHGIVYTVHCTLYSHLSYSNVYKPCTEEKIAFFYFYE